MITKKTSGLGWFLSLDTDKQIMLWQIIASMVKHRGSPIETLKQGLEHFVKTATELGYEWEEYC